MRLKFFQGDYQVPSTLQVPDLRDWILLQLAQQGEPLRWSITAIFPAQSSDSLCQLSVEAILILPNV